jgi:hypothetical protein
MRSPAIAIVLLVLLALVPIGAWAAMAASLDPVGLGRSIGLAILVVLSPLAFAGLLMILGAVMFKRTQRAGRIVATVGAGIVLAGALVLSGLWFDRVGRCVEGSSFCTDRLVEAGGFLLYGIAHAALIALIWRARRGDLSSVGGAR